jgi:hypothetical protein
LRTSGSPGKPAVLSPQGSHAINYSALSNPLSLE